MTKKGSQPAFVVGRGSCYRNARGWLEGPTYRQCTKCRKLYKRWTKRQHYCPECTSKHYTPKEKESQLLRSARQRAKAIGMEHTITLDDIVIPETCPILGIELDRYSDTMKANSVSLDRLDNSKGYTPDNVWVISSLANTMKSYATPEQLVAFGKWTKKQFKW